MLKNITDLLKNLGATNMVTFIIITVAVVLLVGTYYSMR